MRPSVLIAHRQMSERLQYGVESTPLIDVNYYAGRFQKKFALAELDAYLFALSVANYDVMVRRRQRLAN